MIPCRREKYASVAFFMISGLQVMSVNISKSLARVVLRSLHVQSKEHLNIILLQYTAFAGDHLVRSHYRNRLNDIIKSTVITAVIMIICS